MGMLLTYLLHFSVPLLIYFTGHVYLSLIPWALSIAVPLLFRGKGDFYPKRPRLDLILGFAAILISTVIVTAIRHYSLIDSISPGTMENFFVELWKFTPLVFMIHHPFVLRRKDPTA
ncbi:MAG: hypothetical protein Q4E76_01725 [Tissierellia bacterium]|nr:hypothetical protein [Tissierellia bacterium]